MRTLVRYDIYNDFRLPDHVAYCYQGEAVGSLAFYNEDTDAVDIYMPKGYYLSEEMIQKSLNESREQFSNFELWAYVHEIEDVEVKQIALNKLFYVYCSFFIHNEFIRKSSFKGFNS
jgi:hypothetical protein